ncbi:uncharacterized, partial [Tachysurus ichikawai]
SARCRVLNCAHQTSCFFPPETTEQYVSDDVRKRLMIWDPASAHVPPAAADVSLRLANTSMC